MNATLEKYQHEVHLNLNVRGLPLSPTLAINELSRELLKQGKDVYKLGLGQSPFPVPEPVVQALRDNAGQKDYLSVNGLEELRQSIALYLHHKHQLHYQWENILVGPGSKELMFLLQLVYYGDLVIPIPSWVSYAPQAHIIGRPVRWVQTSQESGWLLTPDDLEELCRKDPTKPRILILNYPNNPTGRSYPDEMLKELAATARKYHVILLSDEIYGELNFSASHKSIARYYPEGTIISGGLSKWCGAGGWRLGLFAFPKELEWLQQGMAAVASETFTSTSAPIQHAAITAFQGGQWLETYLAQSRRILHALSEYICRNLQEAGVKVTPAEGGFYLFPDFTPFTDLLASRNITTSEDLCNRILEETGVAILPGSAFGMTPRDLQARLAFVDFDGERALRALENQSMSKPLSDEFLQTYCTRITIAIEKLTAWLK
ncbi:pyridoxal phosphate-dependent aminotransferase [Desulfosediminicola flagellatus]|uniref:pyridoxal phosphate-dependent aminotransferase n=1 Tax=Desulfosediminicola flagellatus TaxID=2569541 RepID=UPI0010AD1ED8|nr:aminotransferase class I/II-fold pyridoxal phosphate-dependent enzyme [Desulfosediminicola flagellatus]